MSKQRETFDANSEPTHRIRPSRREVAATPPDARNRIMTAGLRLFSSLGFDATGTKRIAEDADVPIGLIFYYFKTKEVLLETILSEHSLVEAVTKAFTPYSCPTKPSEQDALEVLSVAALELLKWLGTHRQWAMLFFRELTMDRPTTVRLRKERSTALELLGKWLVDLSASSARPIWDSESAAQMLASGLLVGALVDRPRDLEAFARRAAATILRGIPPPN